MEMKLEEFRREVAQLRGGRKKGAPVYPERLRRFAIEHVGRRLGEGAKLKALEQELGVSVPTLHLWTSTGKVAFRRVQVRATGASRVLATPSLIVVTPAGYRAEGLDTDQVAVLLRALG